jgi:hypothetical protein
MTGWFAMADSVAPDSLDVGFPLFATQGGGYARFQGGKLVWHELPDWCPAEGFAPKVGDPIPEDWDYQPANEAARRQLADDDRDLCGGFPADEEVSLTGTYGCFD